MLKFDHHHHHHRWMDLQAGVFSKKIHLYINTFAMVCVWHIVDEKKNTEISKAKNFGTSFFFGASGLWNYISFSFGWKRQPEKYKQFSIFVTWPTCQTPFGFSLWFHKAYCSFLCFNRKKKTENRWDISFSLKHSIVFPLCQPIICQCFGALTPAKFVK